LAFAVRVGAWRETDCVGDAAPFAPLLVTLKLALDTNDRVALGLFAALPMILIPGVCSSAAFAPVRANNRDCFRTIVGTAGLAVSACFVVEFKFILLSIEVYKGAKAARHKAGPSKGRWALVTECFALAGLLQIHIVLEFL
jgi:hypothetical protein